MLVSNGLLFFPKLRILYLLLQIYIQDFIQVYHQQLFWDLVILVFLFKYTCLLILYWKVLHHYGQQSVLISLKLLDTMLGYQKKQLKWLLIGFLEYFLQCFKQVCETTRHTVDFIFFFLNSIRSDLGKCYKFDDIKTRS